MSSAPDITTIETQERTLVLSKLDSETAFNIGLASLQYAKSQYPNRSVVVDITTVAGATLFRSYSGEIQPDNEDWIKKKRNTVIRFEKSSLRFGGELQNRGKTLADKALDPSIYTNYGGGFPLRLQTAPGITIAVLTVSGLADHQDHDVAVNGLKKVLEI
ncbi:hypothetical protein WICPIJ_000429 [Wickerhamomyces pijperi]|uniref:Heme-degrading domain-containing protein n=1 Tax=Wickerhamomyces pijperi TaxID=599730 RepID=A0A9P8QGN9_WICPI|nr:hypothetical protein WICPIJ_000429 [Wickerhamomyces pijperi]